MTEAKLYTSFTFYMLDQSKHQISFEQESVGDLIERLKDPNENFMFKFPMQKSEKIIYGKAISFVEIQYEVSLSLPPLPKENALE